MSDYPRCATCKYWVPFEGIHNWPIPDGWQSCSIAESHNGEIPVWNTLAYALDQEEYEGYLVTAPDFGCIQHEPKDEKP